MKTNVSGKSLLYYSYTLMSLSHVDGQRFRKMVVRASGSKSQLPAAVQKTLKDAGSTRFLKTGAKVSRRQATKVIHALQDAGLAPKAARGASGFISKEFTKENQRQENIKRQNLQERKDEIEAEKQAELAAKSGKNPKKAAQSSAGSSAATTFAANSVNSVQHQGGDPRAAAVAAELRRMKEQSQKNGAAANAATGPMEWPEEWKKADDELIDLAID